MVAHANLPNNELHEPKDANLADEGMVYRSDGAGSGNWTYDPQGFAIYNHSSGVNQVVTSTETKLILDHQDTTLVEDYLPREIRGSGSFWDNDNSRFTPIAIGDSYLLSLEVPILSESGNPQEFRLAVDVGNQATPSVVVREELRVTGRSTPYTLYFVFPTAVLSPVGLSGFQFFVETDAGSVTLGNPGFAVQRISAGAF